MDTGQGHFEMIEELEDLEKLKKQYPMFGATFQEGETVEIKGSLFEISKIIRGGLKLKLLPKPQWENKNA